MLLAHTVEIFTRPNQAWQSIHDETESPLHHLFNHLIWLALLPPLCWYIGTTTFGWSIGSGPATKLTSQSALIIALLFYGAILVMVMLLGALIHWMAQTYDANSSFARSLKLAGYTVTPLLLSGLLGIYPALWFDLVVGLVAIGYTVYLLYQGTPIMMEISPERGVLFSSAVIAVGLVMVVALMGATVILWSMGAAPQFVS